ncbi:MAG: hypothetical protein MUC91_05315 [Verrucomicrobia bacterium]|jgi:hypothetical protein|nr:hypothetical protein [Verrucomicrobiota bacterium]
MTHLELTAEEQKLLRETLERGIRDLDMEVLHTDSRDFKEMLKHRKQVLDHLLGKLKGVQVPA